MHRVQRCGLLLLMFPLFRGLCFYVFVCLLDITTSCAKTNEPIEMPFGMSTEVSK